MNVKLVMKRAIELITAEVAIFDNPIEEKKTE